ncbi:MAG: F0F1 ATP synthase subunit A [Verrucomicrobiae bacterium]|nr:F0F1 ATP synthase subunit A [Verrucomicrobiae bacterium]
MLVLGLSLSAEPVAGVPWLTNSMIYSVIVACAIAAFVQAATRRMSYVPAGVQNFLEMVIEGIYGMLEGIVGHHMIKRTFPLLCTLFLYILVANWASLVPGVGSIGWGHATEHGFHVARPILRPPNADVNMTLAMTIIFFVMWIRWVGQEQGLAGFLKHTFAPKGVKGIVALALAPIFFAVGGIEIVSIALRGISLPIRLFGNNFAGENLLHAMATITPWWWANDLILVLFYFLELLIGLVQALVFMLLCSVYIQLNTAHEEGGH